MIKIRNLKLLKLEYPQDALFSSFILLLNPSNGPLEYLYLTALSIYSFFFLHFNYVKYLSFCV